MMSASTQADWTGAFSPLAFTDVLKRVAKEQSSGELQIVSGNWIKTIVVDKGAVRAASSNMRQDRLGESMLSHDFISSNDFKAASERMANDGCRFGEALVQMGRLNPKQLQRELAVQVQRIVLSLFRVSEGLYRFEASEGTPEKATFSLPVPPLVLKGLRRIDDGRLLLGALPPTDTRVRVSATPAFPVDRTRLASFERALLDKAEDGATVGDLVRNANVPRRTALRSCYGLLTLGILEIETEAAPVEAPPATTKEPARETIESRYEQLDALAEEDLLGVQCDASEQDLKAAYKRLSAEWSGIREQTHETELLEKIDAIEFRFAAAYHQLLVERDRTTEELGANPDPTAADPARDARVEQLVRDAKLHLQVEDCNGALSLLHELVALEPSNPYFQVMLGQAMVLHPTLDKSAEEHFLQAVELSPEDAEVRVTLGRYYQSMKQNARATAEFSRALDIDPEHEEAKRYLDATGKPTGVKGLFSKLFG